MIASWMAYCLVLGAFLAGGALLMDRALRTIHLPTRRVWVVALAVGSVLPVLAWAVRGLVDAERQIAGTPEALLPYLSSALEAAEILPYLDGPLLLVWMGLSTLLFLFLGFGLVRLARERRSWDRQSVGGHSVLVSRTVGPAVVGVFRPEIVLPAWAVEEEEELRGLMLRHEMEHVREGDPIVLMLTLVLPMAMPWNLPLWWIAHRLRLAVEVDCDSRVLANHPRDKRAYGALLLEVGRRNAQRGLPMAAFSRSRSQLEVRIERMTGHRVGASWTRGALWGMGGLAVVFSSALVPAPPTPDQLSELRKVCFLNGRGNAVTNKTVCEGCNVDPNEGWQ